MPKKVREHFSDFTMEVVKVLYEKALNERSKIVLQIVVWGRNGAPVLEYRRHFLTKNFGWKGYKLVGLDKEAWIVVMAQHEEITRMLRGER